MLPPPSRQPPPAVPYVCPFNGEVRRCEHCLRMASHLRVELVRGTNLIPDCATHKVKLVRSEHA